MSVIRTFFVSLGMYTRFPLKLKNTSEASPRQLLFHLIATGGVVGLLWKLLCDGIALLQLPVFFASAVLMIFPYWITGYLHLEAYMESSAVILSGRQGYRAQERHGAFGVISLVALLLLGLSGMHSFVTEGRSSFLLFFMPLISRELTVLTLFLFPALSGERNASAFQNGKSAALLMLLFILTVILCITLTGTAGSLMVTAMLCAFLISSFSAKAYIGITGDTAGYALTLSEVAGLVVLVLFKF